MRPPGGCREKSGAGALGRRGMETPEHSCRLTHFPLSGAISSGFRLEESPFVPYDFINSSASPASPPAPVGDGWPRAKSPSGSSSVNWPPGKGSQLAAPHSWSRFSAWSGWPLRPEVAQVTVVGRLACPRCP